MIVVSNVILTYPVWIESPSIEQINALSSLRDQQFNDVDACAGGGKHLETHVLVAAFNHVYTAEVIEDLKELSWLNWRGENMWKYVQLFVCEQDDDIFTERLGHNEVPDQRCGGCPHGYHPTAVCGEPTKMFLQKVPDQITSLVSPCPCSYDIDEGPLDVEEETPQWHQAFPLSS